MSFSSARRLRNTSSRSARNLNFTSLACSFAIPSRAAPRCRRASLLRLRWTPGSRSRKCVAKVGMPCCTVVVCGVMGGRVMVAAVAAPSARPGSPNSTAEARRLRRVPTAALLRSPPPRDYLMPSAVMRCALARVAERRWPSDPDRAPAVRGRLRTLGKGPGPPVRLPAPHSKTQGARALRADKGCP